MDFYTKGSIIMDYGLWTGILVNVNWWTSRCDVIVMFYHLFELSFWRHPFTTEDSLVSKRCNDTKFLQICSDEETNFSMMTSGCVHFQQIFIFGWTIPLKFKANKMTSAIITDLW